MKCFVCVYCYVTYIIALYIYFFVIRTAFKPSECTCIHITATKFLQDKVDAAAYTVPSDFLFGMYSIISIFHS